MFFDINKGFDNQSIESHHIQRPLIGISANYTDSNSALHTAYSDAIISAGGTPVIIPVTCKKEIILSIVKSLDGVLLSGGDDIDARFFGEENIEGLTQLNLQRDNHELMLTKAALDRSIPLFGICRGCQIINIALGGDIYQDLPSMYEAPLLSHSILENRHLGVHDVTIDKSSMLYEILGDTEVSANSRHHQAVRHVAPCLRAVAKSTDGVIEAVEGYPIHQILAVQWHPENMATTGDNRAMQRLFKFFVDESTLYAKARSIHSTSSIVDSHCDTPMLYQSSGFDLGKRNTQAQVDIVKMEQGGVDATITVAYIPQSTKKNDAPKLALSTLVRFMDDISKYPDYVSLARNSKDIADNKSNGKRSIMLGVENGLALGDDLSNLDILHEMGVIYITLCHNGANDICDSAVGAPQHSGVSEFGARVISRMNELGITVDISHSSHQSTLDAITLSRQPIIASHSSCKALCDHPRNLSDEAIHAIAQNGGVVQVCAYAGFLSHTPNASRLDIIEHAEHIIKLVGYNHVGIGSDFDGGGGVEGFMDSSDFKKITIDLLRQGHSPMNISRIMGGNILRVITHNQLV